MSQSMIDKIAKTIYCKMIFMDADEHIWEDVDNQIKDHYRHVAKATIETLKNPNDEIMDAFRCAGVDEWNSALDKIINL